MSTPFINPDNKIEFSFFEAHYSKIEISLDKRIPSVPDMENTIPGDKIPLGSQLRVFDEEFLFIVCRSSD